MPQPPNATRLAERVSIRDDLPVMGSATSWRRLRAALGQEPLPAAIVDLDALDANVATLARSVSGSGKTIRVATKSIRCPELVRRILERAGGAARGLMTYTAAETAYLAQQGFDDLLLAYPTAHPRDVELLARANRDKTAAVVVDDRAHLEVLDGAAREAGTRVPVVIEVDMAYRPVPAVSLGVRRSPLREARDVAAFAKSVAQFSGLRFHGIMAYEAQIAGLGDRKPAVRAMKALSRLDVVKRRAEIREALVAEGLAPTIFNGGGSGSVVSCAAEPALTEIAAGSGFVDSHLFDHYRDLRLAPAAYFALQVARKPAPGFVTCHGGGYVASGAAGPDRLPIVALPEGLALTKIEGAGEVQTPVRVPPGVELAIGDPVFFRHAKAGELAEHFLEYLLVRGDEIVARAPTYRGLGLCFLG
jgi:D-serine deaminase-like pyridoxal phosphate-dependent protein